MATSTVTATLKETTANVALAGRTVTFSTDAGTVGGSASTDAQGKAAVTYTAGTATGTAVINATYGGLVSPTQIELITSASAAIALESTETELQVLGTGGMETSMITATVWDAQGNLVPAGTSVTLVASTGTFSNGQVTITKLTDGSGQVSAAYQSGTTSGTVTFTATSGTASGSAALLTIRSGPATQILVSYDSAAIPTPVDGMITIQISALASDAYGNTVEDGTQIFFELTAGATFGAITPMEVTADGVAKATLTYPDTNTGQNVTIQASTLGGTVTGTLAIVGLP